MKNLFFKTRNIFKSRDASFSSKPSSMNIHPLTLTFYGDLENKFQEDYFHSSIGFLRISFLLGALYYTLFAFLDELVFPDLTFELATVRFAIVFPTISMVFLLSFTKSFKNWWQIAAVIAVVVAGAGIVIMTVITTELGRTYYYPGIMLVLFYCYMLIRLRFVWATLAGWSIFFIYLSTIFLYPGVKEEVTIINFFFIGSANVLGMFGGYALEYYARKDFFFRHLLEEESRKVELANLGLEEKVKEKTRELHEDIKRRKHVETELRKLSRAVEQSPTSVIITDTEGKIEYVNPIFTEITGYSLDEIKGKNPRILKTDQTSKTEYKNLWKTIISGKTWKGEFLNRKKNGELFWESATISSIKNDNDEVTHYIAIKEDISNKKQMTFDLIEAKEKAEKSEKLKSDFLAQMSHEIRTPINTTINYSFLIRDLLKDTMTPDLEEYFKIIQSANKRLMRTIDLILNISEIQTGNYQPNIQELNLLDDVFEDIAKEFQRQIESKGLSFNITNKVSEPIIRGDQYSLVQIFVNLIDNAIKYTNKGKIEVEIDKSDKTIQVMVSDTGIGISEEYIEKLFEPFLQEQSGYTRRYEGNGLGLALVKKYCEINNAEISVESVKDKGSTFTVTFTNELK